MLKPGNDAAYLDPSLPPSQRVEDLLGRMSVAEKLAQLGSQWVLSLLDGDQFSPAKAGPLLRHGIGHVTRPAGATTQDSAGVARTVNAIQRHLLNETRLGIPATMHEESLHGVLATEDVVYPQAIGMAAAWNPDLVEQVSLAIGTHLRALGATQTLSPVLDLGVEPRWGRIEETLGEDPVLVAETAAAAIRGLQRAGVAATAKHLAGHGAPEGGRNRGPVHLGNRELRDEVLYPFEVAVRREGVGSVMHAYNDLDGLPCVANRWLLTDVLRQEWGFDGVVVSDYNGIEELVTSHRVAADWQQAAALALRAGLDVELPSTATFGDPLRAALDAGMVTEADLDTAVRHVLAAKFRAGLFEDPFAPSDPSGGVNLAGQRTFARQLASESLVLLHNRANVLPLRAPRSIAVLGPVADSYRDLLGGYSHVPHIEHLIELRDTGNVFDFPVPDDLALEPDALGGQTVLGAVREAFPDATVQHHHGCGLSDTEESSLSEAVALAAGAEVAVVVVGDRSGLTDDSTTGEARDHLDLGLTGRQQDLVQAVVETGTPTVVVSVSGRPPSWVWAAEHAGAVLHAWVPGEQGAAAIAAALSGAVEPTGRLPLTVLRHSGQIPLTYRHKPSGGRSHWKGDYVDGPVSPLYPFGHGLGYTTFQVNDLELSETIVPTTGTVAVSCRLTNTGDRPGTHVVQLYTRAENTSVTRPVCELVWFARVSLEAGQVARVAFEVPIPFLSFTGRDMRRGVEPGEYTFWVGSSAADLPASARLQINGERHLVADRSHYTPRATWQAEWSH